MKFGEAFLVHQNSLWADLYIDYQKAKALLKAADQPGLEDYLSHYADLLDNFQQQKEASIRKQEAAIYAYYALYPHGVCGPTAKPGHAYSLFSCVAEQIQFMMDYTRVTRNAMDLIVIKYGSSRLADKPLVACGRLQQTLLSAEKLWSRGLWRINQVLERQAKLGAERDCVSQLLNFQQDLQDLPDLGEHVSIEFVQAVEQLLLHQASGVSEVLATLRLDESSPKGQNSLRAGVIASIIHRSEVTLHTLLPRLCHITTMPPGTLLMEYVHYYVAILGRRHQAKEMSGPQTAEALRQMLDQLHPEELRAVLNRPDISGRLALHHAAEYGLAEVCNELLGRAKKVDMALPAKQVFRTTQQMYGDSPLHMAVAKGYTRVVKVLLAYLEVERLPHDEKAVQMCESLLLLSIRSQYPEAASLVRAMISVFCQQDLKRGQMLYLASLYGNADAVDALLAAGVPAYTRHASLDQTPLIVASIQGHLAVVELLLKTKCDWGARDLRGWRAIEHAAFRGFPAVVEMLQAKKKKDDDDEPEAGIVSDVVAPRIVQTVKKIEKEKFHQTVASNYGRIFVNLGSFDLEKPTAESVDIEPYLRAIMPSVMPKSSLTLKISCPGFARETYVVQLPVIEDRVNEPWCFESTQPDSTTLVFELFTSISEDGLGEPQPVAVAVALLGDLRKTLERGNESLLRSHTIPLIGHCKNKQRMMPAGALTFTFVVARPFQRSHDAVLPNPPDPLTRREGATIVGGHRGLGQNIKADMQLQMGENTLESFAQACRLGAAVLEMDVQVTKDDVPVIYHDFLVSETGADIPMHELSRDQFMVLSDVQSPPSKTKSGAVASRPRALSTGSAGPCDHSSTRFIDRMQTTFEYGSSGFKPNIRGQCVHRPFITLADVLTKVERHVCLDIEIKYPMLYESRYWSMNTFAMEINRFLDNILDVIYQHGGSRPIYFSSFSPEVCIVLAAKQTIYPILFLNDSSNWDTFDPRAVSVQSAMHFARAFGLPGIVMASEPLIDAPRLISFMKEQGLYVASYGSLNDDGDKAKIQARAGLDCILVNKVRKIAMALQSA